jgi:hypothetical protein
MIAVPILAKGCNGKGLPRFVSSEKPQWGEKMAVTLIDQVKD